MSALLKLCAFASVFVFSSSFAHAQEAPLNGLPCHATIGWQYWNLSILTGTQINGPSTDGAYTFWLNMCGVAPACRRDGAMACQQSTTDSTVIYDVAYPNDDKGQHYWSIIPGGISLTAFGSGLYCQDEGYERTGVIDVICDTTVTGPVTATTGPVVEGPPCTYTYTINHISGCGTPVVNTTAPPPTTLPSAGSSTDQSTVTGAGVGVGIAIGVAITAVGVLAYAYVARRGSGGSKWNKFGEDKNVNMGNMGHTSEATNM